METQHIFNEYNQYKIEYTKKYGENTIILMQVGTFYEIYAVINDNIQIGEVNIYHICQNILDIVVTRRNKKIKEVSMNNYLQAGVGVDYVKKYVNKLLNNNYTIVIVDQVTQKPNVERKVTRILSPGTYIENYNSDDSNYLMSIYIEDFGTIQSSKIRAGISIIDLCTGKCYLHNIHHNIDSKYWIDEISRYINFYNPKEYLFQTKDYVLTYDTIINHWDINHNSIQINHYTDKCYVKINYQNEILKKIYSIPSQLTPIEHLNLESKNELRNSFIYLLEYVNEHTIDVLNNINYPEEMHDINYLSLTSNSIRQLNIINNYSYYKGSNESLLSICNHCRTPMGRRLLKYRLMYPSIDGNLLNNRYDIIDIYRQNDFYKLIQNDLDKVIDLEKMVRRIGLSIITPNELFNSYLSYEVINKIIQNINGNDRLIQFNSYYKGDLDMYNNFFTRLTNTFNFDNFSIYGLQRSYFKKGNFLELDKVDNYYSVQHNLLLKISEILINIIEKHISKESKHIKKKQGDLIKVDYNEKYNWYLYITKKRSQLLKDIFIKNIEKGKSIIPIEYGGVSIKVDIRDITFKTKDNSNVFIYSPVIKELSSKLIATHKELCNLNKVYLTKSMDEIYNMYSKCLNKMNDYISEVDVSSNNAFLSIHNNYNRPIVDNNNTKSFLEAYDIRHPIVERIHVDTEYITNNIVLGKDNIDGILLFGTNACGKSTLMKSVGISIIMAQAGLFVPCTNLTFKPYTQLFTRILNNDNIFRSQSTFAVEMSELRCILKCSNENSLILGDELCSGTETLSAISIVSEGIRQLSLKGCSFILTSHLHQLTNLKCINEIKNLRINHLKIDIDKGVLIYNRKLVEGSGPSVYGLKVCEAMGLPSEFIVNSKKTLSELEGTSSTIINNHKSIYNSNIYMDTCKICSNPAEETHHIKEQCLANEYNMIDHYHKNKEHNLVPLCKGCHLKVTHGKLLITGYKDTYNGRTLCYYYKSENRKKKKFDGKVDIIQKYITEYNHSITQCIHLLELKEDIKISKPVLKQIMEDLY